MCKQCDLKPVYEFTNKRKLCRICFVRYFQKKFLYIVRKFKMIKKGEIVAYENKGNLGGVVLENLLEMFTEKARVEIIKLSTKRKFNKKAITSTIDSESDKIIHILIKGDASKLKEIAPVDGKIIKPLYLFLDKEILLYAKIKKLKFAPLGVPQGGASTSSRPQSTEFGGKDEKVKKDKISQFIEDLEKKHPEIKRATLNSYLELYS